MVLRGLSVSTNTSGTRMPTLMLQTMRVDMASILKTRKFSVFLIEFAY